MSPPDDAGVTALPATGISPRGGARLSPDLRREAILDAAQAVFLEVGFSAASMSTIAARVGGSKGTLYNYFKSKEELFEAYVQRHCAWQLESMTELLSEEGEVGQTLSRVGRKLLEITLSGWGLKNFLLVTAEAHRSPDIGRAFYEAGPRTGQKRLAAYFERQIAAGRLREADPLLMAHHFMALCQARLLKARLCNAAPEPSPEEIAEDVDAAVDTFLRGFGVN